MRTQIFPVTGRVREDKSLEQLAREISQAGDMVSFGSSDKDLGRLMETLADYRMTRSHWAVAFEANAVSQECSSAGGGGRNAAVRIFQQSPNGRIEFTPDHCFSEVENPKYSKPSSASETAS